VTHPYFPALVIGHEPIDLSHLEPFTFEVQSHIAGKALRVHVTFSNHCFSKGFHQKLTHLETLLSIGRLLGPERFVLHATGYRILCLC